MNAPKLMARLVALAVLAVPMSGRAVAEDTSPPRVVVVLSSSDAILADLEHMVVDLAGRKTDWEKSVFPNIDIFLIGVDKSQPVRYDQIIGGEGGRREQLMVPIANLTEFIKDNLDPIGIVVRQDRRQKDLYRLSEVYEGWMRVKENYARFARKEHPEDVPSDMPHPSQTHKELLAQGYDVAVELDNSRTSPEDRQAAFAAFRDNTLAGIQKRPDETEEAFQLRKTNSAQSLETLERLFVESSRITIGIATDTKKSVGSGKLVLAPRPDTPLQASLKAMAEQPSRFAAVPRAEDPVLSGRLNFALDEMLVRQMRELYGLLRPVVQQRIDKTENLTEDQKTARKEVSNILLDILTASLDLGKVDGVVEVTQQSSGKHTGVMAVCAAEGGRAAKIVELLPASDSAYRTEMNIDQAGQVDIHKVTVTEGYPKALQQFFGDSGEVYVGTGPDTVWLSVGEGALEALKAGIAAAGEAAPEGPVDPTVARLDLDLLPVLQLMNQLRKDGDFDLMATLKRRGLVEEPPPEGTDESSPAADTRRMLQDFEWRDAAIQALDSKADRLHLELRRVEDRLEGEATIERGILKALGEVIAKFARENLG